MKNLTSCRKIISTCNISLLIFNLVVHVKDFIRIDFEYILDNTNPSKQVLWLLQTKSRPEFLVAGGCGGFPLMVIRMREIPMT